VFRIPRHHLPREPGGEAALLPAAVRGIRGGFRVSQEPLPAQKLRTQRRRWHSSPRHCPAAWVCARSASLAKESSRKICAPWLQMSPARKATHHPSELGRLPGTHQRAEGMGKPGDKQLHQLPASTGTRSSRSPPPGSLEICFASQNYSLVINVFIASKRQILKKKIYHVRIYHLTSDRRV